MLSGRIDATRLGEIERVVDAESGGGATIDLGDVALVDREAVAFLARCEHRGIRLVRCPGYVREWIDRL